MTQKSAVCFDSKLICIQGLLPPHKFQDPHSELGQTMSTHF
jgi:hypothetical protein